jgi:hypothetical protein
MSRRAAPAGGNVVTAVCAIAPWGLLGQPPLCFPTICAKSRGSERQRGLRLYQIGLV